MIKTGIGYDVHQLKKGMPLIIGGVLIKSSMGSVGHSDGDGLIHAICDSLLGASGIGDIGTFFPSDNKKWENNDEDKSYSGIKESLDVVFVLVDDFDGEKASEGEKYALVRPVDVGLSSEDHYSVKTGLKEDELIVTGRFRVLSKALQHGMKVKYEQESGSD